MTLRIIKKPNSVKAASKVGYKSPPPEHRFQPGISGNPAGRPKNSPSFAELMEREARKIVQVKTANGMKKVAKLEALANVIFQKALAGDLKAAVIAFGCLPQASTEALEAQLEEETLSANLSKETMQAIGQRLLRISEKPDGET